MSEKILAIETSSIIGGVALIDSEDLIDEIKFRRGMIHAKKLVPSIQKILKKHRLKPKELDCISISIGPGSYTGLRVGLACAKILSYTTNAKLVAVNSLDIISCNPVSDSDNLVPVVDARWEQIYTSFYRNNKDHLNRERLTEPLVVSVDVLKKLIPEKSFLFGDALKRYGQFLKQDRLKFGEEKYWYPKPRYCALLGLKMFRKQDFSDVFQIVPLYLRLTEAEVKRNLKTKL